FITSSTGWWEKISERTSLVHLIVSLQARWNCSGKREVLLASFWLVFYVQGALSQQISGAFVSGDYQSSWEMILPPSSRPAL
ncbi:Uncharacterized protein DAT39_018810, partial [Clarias magur]